MIETAWKANDELPLWSIEMPRQARARLHDHFIGNRAMAGTD